MQFVKGKPPETQYATCPGDRAKRREVALGRPGFEPGRIARMAEFKAIPRPENDHVSPKIIPVPMKTWMHACSGSYEQYEIQLSWDVVRMGCFCAKGNLGGFFIASGWFQHINLVLVT
jgi:hypothetical protein